MHWLVVLSVLAVGCGSSTNAPAPKPAPVQKPAGWTVPAGWKSELIPFPLEFAPLIQHTGAEELRFPPGFFDEKSGEYFSYAFIWRTTDAAEIDAKQLGGELSIYFQGLTAEVDRAKKRIEKRDGIAVTATANGARFDLVAKTYDPFTTSLPVDLVGWAERVGCKSGAIWIFVLAPAKTTIRKQLDELATAAKATCDRG